MNLKVFLKMNFSYDLYTKTCDEYHKKHVEEMFLKMYKNKYIYPKKIYNHIVNIVANLKPIENWN